ncbi:MAG: CBS domain-containing protein [Candidatus Hydrothermarchaeota archaeon]
MLVKEIMITNPTTVKVPSNTIEAIEIMKKHNLSSLPVVKEGTDRLVGIVTRSDLARNPEEEQLALVMVRDPVTVSPHDDIKEAAKIMVERGFRRLPVVDGESLVGLVSVHDIVTKVIPKTGIKKTAENIMTRKCTLVWSKTPLSVALEILRLSGERSLVAVENDGRYMGVVSEKDFVSVLEEESEDTIVNLSTISDGDIWTWERIDSKDKHYVVKEKFKMPDLVVENITNKEVLKVTKKTPIQECARRMKKSKIDILPVIDAEGRIEGVVKDTDLVRIFLDYSE